MSGPIPKEMEIMTLIQIMKEPGSVYSYEKPNEALLERNAQLLHFLNNHVEEYSKLLSSTDGIEEAERAKNNTVREFEQIVNSWMEEVNAKKGGKGVAKVVLYGSKASRTSLKSDDIDLLVMAPRYVERLVDDLTQVY